MTRPRTTTLARHLMCAVPQLQDPNFRRSVVLMLEHGPEGALGLVVNNLLPNTIGDVAEGLGIDWAGDADARVRLGGPVEPMRGWIVHDQSQWDPDSTEILPGVHLTTSLDPIDKDAPVGANGSQFLFLLGYANWGAAQLEGEIAAGSWVAVPIALDDGDHEDDEDGVGVDGRWLFEAEPERMWEDALRSIGVDPGRLVGLKGGDAALH